MRNLLSNHEDFRTGKKINEKFWWETVERRGLKASSLQTKSDRMSSGAMRSLL